MSTGLIISIIAGLILVLVGICIGLYFLIFSDGGDDGGKKNPPNEPVKPGPPRNVIYSYQR